MQGGGSGTLESHPALLETIPSLFQPNRKSVTSQQPQQQQQQPGILRYPTLTPSTTFSQHHRTGSSNNTAELGAHGAWACSPPPSATSFIQVAAPPPAQFMQSVTTTIATRATSASNGSWTTCDRLGGIADSVLVTVVPLRRYAHFVRRVQQQQQQQQYDH